MLRHELEVAENIPDHPLYQYDALQAKNELLEQPSQYHLGQPPFRQYTSQFSGPIQYWNLHRVSQFSFILSYLAEKIFSVLPNSMCDERTGSRLTYLYSKLRARTDANTMIEQIQFSQFNAIALTKKPSARRQKGLLWFRDIPQECLPENNTSDTDDVALTDEPGEDWLDTQAPPPLLEEMGEQYTLLKALNTHGIDLTSQLLISALSTTSVDTFSLPSSSVEPSPGSSSIRPLTYTRAADMSWDD